MDIVAGSPSKQSLSQPALLRTTSGGSQRRSGVSSSQELDDSLQMASFRFGRGKSRVISVLLTVDVLTLEIWYFALCLIPSFAASSQPPPRTASFVARSTAGPGIGDAMTHGTLPFVCINGFALFVWLV